MKSRAYRVVERRYVPLDDSIPGNKEIERLLEKLKKDQAITKQEKARQQRQELTGGVEIEPGGVH